MQTIKFITRHGVPNEYDLAPRGSICFVKNDLDGNGDNYIQMSDDEDKPRWEKQ